MRVYSNPEALSRNYRRGKAINVTYSECVFVALIIQHSKRMRPITLPFVACPDLPYFSTLSNKRHDFLKKVIQHEMCVLIFSTTLSETFLILRRTQRDIIKAQTSSYKVPVILVRF
jgi:hypothetical protein